MSPEALREQLAELHQGAFGWAFVCANGKRGVADETLSAAYTKILSAQVLFRGDATFRSFVYGVIRLTALETMRERSRWFRRLSILNDVQVGEHGEHQSFDSAEAKLVWSCVTALPERQKQIVVLMFYGGMSLTEAADAMGINRGSASQHYARGKEVLAQSLREKGFP